MNIFEGFDWATFWGCVILAIVVVLGGYLSLTSSHPSAYQASGYSSE